MNEPTHIGYTERPEGYYKMYSPPKGSIYPTMGPRVDAVCIPCYEKDPDCR